MFFLWLDGRCSKPPIIKQQQHGQQNGNVYRNNRNTTSRRDYLVTRKTRHDTERIFRNAVEPVGFFVYSSARNNNNMNNNSNNADDKIRLNLLKRLQADQAAIDKYIKQQQQKTTK